MPTIKLGRRELKAITEAAAHGRAATLFQEAAKPDSGVRFEPGKAITFFDEGAPGFGVRVSPGGGASYVLHYRPKPGGRKTPKQLFTIGSVDAMTLEAARQQAGDLKAGIRIAKPGEGADPAKERTAARRAETLHDLVRAYLDDHVAPDRKATTLALYEGYLRNHIAPRRDADDDESPLKAGALGAMKANAVTGKALNDLRLKIGRTHKRTANAVITLVASAYTWGVKNKRLPEGLANPANGVGRFPANKRKRGLTDDQWAALGETLALAESGGLPRAAPKPGPKSKHAPKANLMIDKHAVACIRLLALTGCRLREILNLEWAHVDFDNRRLNLPDSKTGAKEVPLPAQAIAILRDLQPTNYKYVIPSESAGRVDERPRADLHRPWARIVEHAGLGAIGVKGEDGYRPPLRIHDLRHANAGNAVALGIPLVLVGKVLGHKDVRTTQGYANPIEKPISDAANTNAADIAAKMAGKRGGVT